MRAAESCREREGGKADQGGVLEDCSDRQLTKLCSAGQSLEPTLEKAIKRFMRQTLHPSVNQLIRPFCLYLLSDRVVDDHGLATDFRAVVRLGQLGGHVQAEVAVPLHLLVTKLDSLAPRGLSIHSTHRQLTT